MQAVILAGGLGTRLWPLTERVPKPMVPIAGAPYLEHQLKYLRLQGIRDIVLLIGYLGDQIVEYFGDGRHLDMHILYSREEAPLGTGGGLREARALLADEFLLIYGDSYLPIAYHSVMKMLANSVITGGVVVVYDNRLGDTAVKNNIAVDADGFVSRYEKDSPARDLQYVEAGVLALRRRVIDQMPTTGPVSLEKEIFPKLIVRRELLGYRTTQRFYDIGTPERLKAIEERLTHDHDANTVSD